MYCLKKIRALNTKRNTENDQAYVTGSEHPGCPEPDDEIKKQVKIRDNYRCLCCGEEHRLEIDISSKKNKM